MYYICFKQESKITKPLTTAIKKSQSPFIIINFGKILKNKKMSFKAFVTSKIFLKHFIYAVFIVVAILWFSLKALDIYTLHGRTITVPDLEGLHIEDVNHITDRLNLRYVVNDSIFDATREKGSVASQDPAPDTQVKRNRTIYLTTVAKLPEMVAMPELTDLTLRQAVSILKSLQLNIGKLEYMQGRAQNSVQKAKFNQGVIEVGTPIERGTYIDLVLGKGESLSATPVPLVVGMPRAEARAAIQTSALNIGNEVFLDNDRVNARVYRQVPNVLSRNHSLRMGSNVNLYYRSDIEFDFDKYLEKVLTVELPYIVGYTPDEAKRILENAFLNVGAEYFVDNVPREDAIVLRQDPSPVDTATVKRETRINIWYKSVYDDEEGLIDEYFEEEGEEDDDDEVNDNDE